MGFSATVALSKDAAPAKADAAAIAHGKAIWVSYGCYQCHGYQGQGGASSGPKIAPDPIPKVAFVFQLRKPRDRMPVYTSVTVSDKDVDDLYAYVSSIPKNKNVSDIPLLNQ